MGHPTPLPYYADDGPAAVMHVHMLDPHRLLALAAMAVQAVGQHGEAAHELAGRRTSERSVPPGVSIPAACEVVIIRSSAASRAGGS